MKNLAKVISLLLHPIFIPSYTALFMVWALPNIFGYITSAQAVFVIRTIVFYTLLYPLFIVFLMKKLGFIDNYNIADRKQRILVFIPMAFMFMWTYTVLYKAQTPHITASMMMGCTIALFLSMIINIMIEKISIHAIGMGGMFAMVLFTAGISIYNISWALMLVVLLGGLVGTARLVLQAHQPREVYNGYMLGFLCMAGAMLL
ncbi:hypothetical protein C7N43_03075 [Sphingobacteriales bacterium UPWRP_1]|nr:hypothetical protein BVG80_09575 [Sphingobacteriales bacterium TSM_CSM]PSJ78600.1 hypothetical protein C7N43_03075 [Sphingobacteriales bacterium UPWRP_1]